MWCVHKCISLKNESCLYPLWWSVCVHDRSPALTVAMLIGCCWRLLVCLSYLSPAPEWPAPQIENFVDQSIIGFSHPFVGMRIQYAVHSYLFCLHVFTCFTCLHVLTFLLKEYKYWSILYMHMVHSYVDMTEVIYRYGRGLLNMFEHTCMCKTMCNTCMCMCM